MQLCMVCLFTLLSLPPSFSLSLRFNLSSQSWMSLNRSANSVTARYGHSLAVHEVCVHVLIYSGCTIHTNKHTQAFYTQNFYFSCACVCVFLSG